MEFTILRQSLSSRGGGMEIDLAPFGYEDEKMTAYQNYLGGGMLGRIANDCTVIEWRSDDRLLDIAENLRQYFHQLTNPDEGEWESLSYGQNQSLPVSAY
jgi:hypothetical protein